MTRLIVPIAAALLTLAAAAQEAGAAVRCDVQVILASAGGGSSPYMDPALRPIAGYLKKSFGARYSSFRQLSRQGLHLDIRQRGTIELPNGRTLALTFKGVKDGFVRLFMELPHLRTTVKIRDGGLFFQAGQSFQGGILILSIRAHLR